MFVPQVIGLTEELIPAKYDRILYRLLMFYARKSILLIWKPPKVPSVSHWISLTNMNLSIFKLNYASGPIPCYLGSLVERAKSI